MRTSAGTEILRLRAQDDTKWAMHIKEKGRLVFKVLSLM